MDKNKVADWSSYPVSITMGELEALKKNQITVREYADLRFFRYLYSAGVDNWEGYSIAYQQMLKENPELQEEDEDYLWMSI